MSWRERASRVDVLALDGDVVVQAESAARFRLNLRLLVRSDAQPNRSESRAIRLTCVVAEVVIDPMLAFPEDARFPRKSPDDLQVKDECVDR